jgi:hypothetical protein
MRSLCLHLAAAVLMAPLVFLAAGCGGGTGELEKPPEIKPGTLSTENMPGMDSIKASIKKPGAK